MLFSTLYKPSQAGSIQNQYTTGLTTYPPINSLYIGWKTCSDSTVNYIIHSIKITSDNSSSILSPTSNAATNRK